MQTLIQLAGRNQHWLTRWVLFPIVAYYASWIVGVFWLMPLVFGVMLVSIQWKLIERLTGHGDALFWWFTPVLYAFVICLVWQLPAKYVSWLGEREIVGCAMVYFGTQAMGEWIISQLVAGWRWGRFALANGLAAFGWLAGVRLLNGLIGTWLDTDQLIVWMGVGIPALSALSNLVTGIGLLAAVEQKPTDVLTEQVC